MKSDEADKLISIAREYYWPAFGRDASFLGLPGSIFESGEGSFCTDILGNRLLDAETSASACYLGFNHPEIVEAMVNEMKKMVNQAPLLVNTPPSILLAEKIASISPDGLKYTLFGSNGTDANDAALKIARQYWKIKGKGTKYKVIHRYPGDYHGMSLSAASASGHVFRRVPYEPLMAGFVAFHAPNCYRCPYNLSYPACDLLCAHEFRKVVEFEDPSTIACFIGETTNTGLGIIIPPPGYMQVIRDICDECEILMILDEVITGIAKTGSWFDCQKHDIVPDMITMGKAISAGCGPLAATHVKSEIAEAFTGKNTLQHGYTFGGMGYLAAAGLVGINYVEKHNLLARASEIGAIMSRELEPIKAKSPVVGDVRVNGALVAIELVRDKTTKEIFPNRFEVASLVNKVGRDNGVMLNCMTWYGNIMQMYLPLTISDEEISMVLNALDKAVTAVEKQYV